MATTDNWYTSVNLPTYNFSLYLANDTVFNNPTVLNNDDAVLRSRQAVLIAQSGKTATYAIDNVNFNTNAIAGSPETAHTSVSVINFDLHEVLGFELYEMLYTQMLDMGYPSLKNSKFVLKLYFQGRDPETDQPVRYPGVFYYQCSVQQITANIGPQGSTYNWTMNCQSRMTLDNSRPPSGVTVQGATVNDFLSSLASGLNEQEVAIRSSNTATGPAGQSSSTATPHKEWKIEWDREFSQYLSSLMLGVQQGDAGSSGTEPNQFQDTIPPETNVTAYLFETLNTSIPAIVSGREDEDWWNGGKTKVTVFSTTDVDTSVIDPSTNQVKQIITLHIGITKTTDTPGDPDPAVEKARRESFKVQNDYLSTITPNIYKRYDFLYTGENTEILDCDLNIDPQFFSTRPPSFNSNSMHGGQFVPLTETTEKVSTVENLNASVANLPQNGSTPVVQDYERVSAAEENAIGSDGTSQVNQQLEDIAGSHDMAFFNLTLDIIGDPFWCGASDSYNDLVARQTSAFSPPREIMIAFINYLPSQAVAISDGQQRGRFDYYTSGIYYVTSVSSRFQAGKYTNTLTMQKNDKLTAKLVQNRLERL